jgi:hypothetical protein
MKPISKNNSQNSQNRVEKQPNPLILALVLTGILTLEIYPTLINTAAANASALKTSLIQLESQESPSIKEFSGSLAIETTNYSEFTLNNLISQAGNLAQNRGKNSPNQLPASVAAALRQELSKITNIPPAQLKVTESSRESWPNTCLGLPKADELCGQMIVEGWRVVISDGRQTWIYRTNARGNVLRLEKKAS